MRFRRSVALGVAAMISSPLVPAPPAAAAQIEVFHSAVSCIVADQYPQLEATAPSGQNVRSARAYFHSALTSEFYYVEGENVGGNRWVFRLPRPNLNAGPITYYIEFMPEGRTGDQTAIVVANSADCEGRPVAGFAPAGPAAVFGPGGVIATPAGFGGVGFSTVSTIGAASAGKGISTALIIAGLAVAAGVAVTVVASDDDEPSSPSR